MRKLHVALLILFLLALPAWAGTVAISVDTPGGIGTAGLVDSTDALAVAWYQPTTLSSVDIFINFQNTTLGANNTYSAYLTDSIGTGTSQAGNEIAFNPAFSGPDEAGWVEVFSNLTLGPSLAYYLIIGTSDLDSYGGWSYPDGPAVVTTNFGITRGDGSGVQYWVSGSDIDPFYLPASNFSPLDAAGAADSGDLLFQVTVPEPSTLWLLAAGGLCLLWRRRRATV